MSPSFWCPNRAVSIFCATSMIFTVRLSVKALLKPEMWLCCAIWCVVLWKISNVFFPMCEFQKKCKISSSRKLGLKVRFSLHFWKYQMFLSSSFKFIYEPITLYTCTNELSFVTEATMPFVSVQHEEKCTICNMRDGHYMCLNCSMHSVYLVAIYKSFKTAC